MTARNNVAGMPPRSYSWLKVALTFLLVGPPISGILIVLAMSLFSVGSTASRANTAFDVLNLYGLLASYVIGFIPSLIAGAIYSRAFHPQEATAGGRLRLAALVGFIVYFLASFLVLGVIFGDRIEASVWLLMAFAAVAGSISTSICALIVADGGPRD
jgi:uncharacterized membrane protein